MKPCPHCGDDQQGVYRNCRAYGWVEEHQYQREGRVEQDMRGDGVHYTKSQTVRCLACGKVRRDVTWDNAMEGGD